MNIEYRKLIAWLLSVALFLSCFGTGEVCAEDNGNSVSGVKYTVSIASATESPTITPPSAEPTATPSAEPTATPSAEPTATPSAEPTDTPSAEPTATPSAEPTATPSTAPTAHPTVQPSAPTLTCGSTVDAIQVVKQNSTVNLSVTVMLSDSNKEQYTYSYEWKWAGEKQSSKNNTCVVKPRKKGVYEWTCTVTAMNSNQTQKASDTISGVICVCQSSGGEVVLTKSLKAQNLCKTVFGVKSGDTQSGVKVTVTKLTAQGKKEKKCWKITKSKIMAKKYLAKGTVKMQMKFQYRGKSLTKTIQVKLRTGIPAGKVTFTLKNGGKKITCKYSKEIVHIVKNRKKYGIRDVDVAIRYSMNGRSYKPVPSLVKGYFNVKRLNKKCFITTAGKYRIKKFKVTLRYKVTGKTQKKNMKVINRLAK